ncbi:calponin-like domain-containing protein [Artemisia annua]|uniref:Calponin-like domain-containing protein n=1 Tax=Artemisia annua TaxID=35608 RepID=A0A2U1LMP9_ARTAN|nr:calponin-like domain-containing protein [Artemisia annua]
MAESEDMTSMGEDVDVAYETNEEDPTNRNEAASWIRKRAGVVAAKDLPAEPSEEAFRLGLQSGMILCNILNKIKPCAVPNVVKAPSAVTTTPDEEAQSAYYENISNFLTAIEEIGLPTFDLYDLDEGGDFSRVVNSILALRAYSETGARKFLWNSKASSIGRSFVRRNSESALNTISRTHSLSSDRLLDMTSQSGDGNDCNEESDSGHLYMIVCDLLEDREEEDIPMIVENIVNKVNEEFETLQEEARKQDEAAKEQERINKEKDLLALQEEARRQEEAAKEQERLRREKDEKETAERIKREQEEKEKAERIKREKEEKEKARKLERERIKQEKKLKAQEEKMRKKEEARARKDQERIQRQKELQALRERAKQEKLSAKELERLNIEKELLEEEERLRQQEEEQERIEREIEQQRAMKKEEYKRRMEEYNKYNVNTEKRQELTAQQDKELQELRSTISAAKTDVRSMQQNCQEEADNLGTHAHTICHAAAGYNKVLEENRKLYNQVQDLKGNIRVYCRIRPFLPGQENNVTSVDYTDEETVAIIIPTKSGREGRKASMFNKVFGPSATQEEVFSDTQPLIRTVLDGFNVCIFACGQTGAGKTYTLTGPDDLKPDTMGVSYRALNDLFNISEERKNLMNYEISINMVEIYNDEIRDLLVEDGTSKILDIVNGSKKGINLPDANRIPVSSTDDVINLMNLCRKNRAMNDHSSRSHSFLTVHVFGKDVTLGTTIRGCMHLVDLAGNEKLDNPDDEATHIQKSISALGDVLVALANKSSRVPYKTCKLTQLLQEALGNQPKILMFVHVHPDIEEAGETLSTFKFVERFSTVEGGAGKSSDVRELKEQICYLKAALAKKEAGDPHWQDLLNSPSGDSEDKSDESAPSKLKSSTTKQPAKSSNSLMKKMAASAAAATRLTRTKK